jgi:probable phosphoglycerate mutase
MTTLLLIRHCENEFVKDGRLAGRLPDVHLNRRGLAQAEALAKSLRGVPIKAIYSSPLERAVETATPIAKSLGIEITIRAGLLETDCGDWEGKTLKGLRRRKLWPTVQNSPSLMRFPNGESFPECQTRIVSEIERIRQQHKPKDIVACVYHSDPIKLTVAFYLSMPLDNFQRLVISTATITVLQITDTGGNLLHINQQEIPEHFLLTSEKRKGMGGNHGNHHP